MGLIVCQMDNAHRELDECPRRIGVVGNLQHVYDIVYTYSHWERRPRTGMGLNKKAAVNYMLAD